ncbi:hypothetical protein [uncultured Ruegeria sp.]|uniref:tetratricopeptide repeat protein n=1 Tax=uncultured Ruegeria sp. TaxID=259304 RepID=UPI00262FAE8C|nr:hypothetical protein [uncultured Ruegeria sp.]
MSTTKAPEAPSAQPGLSVSAEEVRAALMRMLSHPEFSASERRRQFLSFVVEETLGGRSATLKGFTIAQAVFGRDESFDHKTDPVVRLEARRLRQDLDSFYVGPGAADPIRIAIPKGGYAPVFETTSSLPAHDAQLVGIDPPASSISFETPRSKTSVAAVAAFVLAVAAAVAWIFWPQPNTRGMSSATSLPKLAFLPFKAVDASQTTRTLSVGLSSELVQKLRGFEHFRLYAPFSENGLKEKMAETGDSDVPAYVVSGEVLTEGDHATILIQLLTIGTEEVVWSEAHDLRLKAGSIMEARDSIAAEIAAVLEHPYGPLIGDIRQRTAALPPSSLESYLCVLQAYAYRRSFETSEFELARTCLDAAVRRNPDYSAAWAMLGWLHLDAARFHFVPPDRVEEEYDAALSAAERAHFLEPDNVVALQALSSIHHYIGNYEEGERFGRLAIARTPHDPDTLAQVGWRLAIRGNFAEGVPLMQRAIERTIDPPGWYYHLLAMHLYMAGDTDESLELSERAAAKGTGFSQFLIAAAAGRLGDTKRTEQALDALADIPFLADPAAFLRSHGATDEIVDTMMSGFATSQKLISGASTEPPDADP